MARRRRPKTSLARRRNAAAISPKAPERARQADLHPGDARRAASTHTVAEATPGSKAQSLISTVEDVELIDPDLSGEAAVVPAVSPARRFACSAATAARAMFVFARGRRLDARELRGDRTAPTW